MDTPIPRTPRKPAIPGGGKRKNRDTRKQARRDSAALRAEQRAERTDAEQLEKLTDAGHGNCDEARRLAVNVR